MIRNRGYPITYRYRGLSTAPWTTVEDWRERLIALAAHEAYHVHQFREGLRRSEVQAERWALRRLMSWRTEPTPVVDPDRSVAVLAVPDTDGCVAATQLSLFGVA